MIKSMTGFGSVRSEFNGHTLTVDIKCLNSKFMDLNLRMPKELQEKEAEIRKGVTDKLGRGKVQISIELILAASDTGEDIIDKSLFKKYYESLNEMADNHAANKSDLFRLAIHMPDVIKSQAAGIDSNTWKWIIGSINEAIDKADQFRVTEGKSLDDHMTSSVNFLENALTDIEEIDIRRRQKQNDRLKDAISDIQDKVKIDQNRFEQELIYYLEKIDITEEKVRLKSHLDYFNKTLKEKESNGKRLQFISQEIGREINTIGSKANDAELQQLVVGMKDELEKIKEQSLNVL